MNNTKDLTPPRIEATCSTLKVRLKQNSSLTILSSKSSFRALNFLTRTRTSLSETLGGWILVILRKKLQKISITNMDLKFAERSH
jgi:hypothetical protein